MAWLIAHMWIALAGAGFLGLLFGWSFRGILLKGKAVRAAVERDVARTELEQAKAEIDSLYAAQRNGKASDAGIVETDRKLQNDLEEREAKLASLTEELAGSRAEIEALKKAALASVGAGALADADKAGTPGDSGAPEERLDAGLNTNDAALEWRNRYLESRLRTLESQTGTMAQSATESALSEEEVTSGEAPVSAGKGETSEEEIARLRWRNRFLEGRVAYFEGGAGEAAADEAGAVQTGPAISSNGHGGLTDVTEETAADAVLRSIDREVPEAVEAKQPETLAAPTSGAGDDLTAISGIGPKIQDVLHGMGVWHYAQIAEWTAENTAWVDQQLSFSGRIEREEWVSQAKILAGKAESGS